MKTSNNNAEDFIEDFDDRTTYTTTISMMKVQYKYAKTNRISLSSLTRQALKLHKEGKLEYDPFEATRSRKI